MGVKYVQIINNRLESSIESLLRMRYNLQEKVNNNSAYTEEQCRDRLSDMGALKVFIMLLKQLGVSEVDMDKYVGDDSYECEVIIVDKYMNANEVIKHVSDRNTKDDRVISVSE